MTEQHEALPSTSLHRKEQTKPKLLVLIGPTAVGKTQLSLDIAKAYNCEIISGDSMQVYRGMDIGTAKIMLEERQGIVHHLIDIREPEEPYSSADFQEECRRLIADITARGKIPFIVGGTGLYIESVCYAYEFAENGSDPEFRLAMEQFADEHGAEALHAKLVEVDPASAERLHPNDRRRIIRALEIFRLTGERMSEQLSRQSKTSPYELCIIGLEMDRQRLYDRINRRIDLMMEQGLEEEARGILARGIPSDAVSLQGLGYKEFIPYFAGQCTLEEAVETLKRDTRRFAKRQLSWFRHMKDIDWVDAELNLYNKMAAVHGIIAGKFLLSLEYISNQSFSTGVTANE
ncbi:tRNA dimethylallyltransferase [Paenibacillus cellulosilyticus]|uniref:tRNA dimethylallyltransferase n=1 Tax=Paenibacillus cellulosilyticus TaxID=375489 RepID=A0A2V2YSQ4_9BACL|nr:tRNA (adenosine(37)-N6)-dimethylallyltransferase MiaA [Paenibacillus cellulosilyticus]PWW00661.1 tRNA dimethylallyltransferase [Paenibacillus cellulosilyticus]QKS45526.1 tRNA (adenosine(37)-N6)-dimethylallyltransferase MiaA [Paenibacillus cellulosilyticus]